MVFNQTSKFIVLLVLSSLIFLFRAGVSFAKDDFQYWSQLSVNLYKSEKINFLIFGDSRFKSDAEKLGLYFVSPRLTYHFSKNLDFGFNYTYLQSRSTNVSASDDSYNRQQRAEFEINPKWKLTEWLNFKMRNRMEFRWIENRGTDDNMRFRQRWGLEVPIENLPPLKSVYLNSEFLYDFQADSLNENRSIPIGLKFRINDKTGFNVFYMIQSQKGVKDWSSNQILGTTLSVSF